MSRPSMRFRAVQDQLSYELLSNFDLEAQRRNLKPGAGWQRVSFERAPPFFWGRSLDFVDLDDAITPRRGATQ